jgi:hypothetical protein
MSCPFTAKEVQNTMQHLPVSKTSYIFFKSHRIEASCLEPAPKEEDSLRINLSSEGPFSASLFFAGQNTMPYCSLIIHMLQYCFLG